MSQAERNKWEFGWVDPTTMLEVHDPRSLGWSNPNAPGLDILSVTYEDLDAQDVAALDESPGEVFVAGSDLGIFPPQESPGLVGTIKNAINRSLDNVKALVKHK
jgi:hypothetical protein